MSCRIDHPGMRREYPIESEVGVQLSTREAPEVCEYPDSAKFLAYAPRGDGSHFDAIQRTTNTLDYWDGEP